MTLTIYRATPADVDAVLGLVTEATRWLAERGSDQWQYTTERHRVAIERAVARGEVWVVSDDTNTIVGTVTLNAYADPEFWTAEDDPTDALYLHRMVVARDVSGNDIGSAMLDWASRQSVDAGKKFLRLDAWATNADLHAYYRRRGFQLVRILRFGHRGSGALFQRPATHPTGTRPRLVEAAAFRR